MGEESGEEACDRGVGGEEKGGSEIAVEQATGAGHDKELEKLTNTMGSLSLVPQSIQFGRSRPGRMERRPQNRDTRRIRYTAFHYIWMVQLLKTSSSRDKPADSSQPASTTVINTVRIVEVPDEGVDHVSIDPLSDDEPIAPPPAASSRKWRPQRLRKTSADFPKRL